MHVAFQSGNAFLRATVSGRFSLAEANDCLAQIFAKALDQGARSVLVDCTAMEGVITSLDRYQHGVFVSEQMQKPGGNELRTTRLAYVVRPPIIAPDRFGETVAVNRGVWGHAFEDEADAVAWLREAPD